MAAWNRQANEIFLKAVDIQLPHDRRTYLDEACPGDAVLRGQVEALIEASERASGFLEHAASGFTAAMNGSVLSERPGSVIGPYKLLQTLGEGGMGVVFMAEQQEPVRRKVALKVIKPGMDTRQVIARFEAERQALAVMDHPNIAKVFDAGTTDSGRPFFVMELVKGVPVTSYCDEKHLTLNERLELFIPVCQAVQHAHQKGIIHRDLKPTNVLIAEYDNEPVPKVIDFGVAKAAAQKLTDRTMFTEFGQVVGTVEYMSPEQAKLNQLDIDTRSDIYSLGVLLYELLTGSTPFARKRLNEAAFDEMLRIIREEEPPKPSTKLSSSDTLPAIAANRHTEPARLSQQMRGELDWIVMKCLEKDRNRRYETASSIAMDAQRYLNNEPVLACPPSAAYRFRKFARRNRAAFLVATTVAAGLLLAVGSLIAAVRVLAASNAEINSEQKQTKNALDREKQTNDALVRSLGREEGTSYFRSIALAERELAANNIGRAEELLDECPLSLRGWEWHFLKRLRYREPLTFRGHNAWVTAAAFSPDGKQIASASALLGYTIGEIKIWDRATGKELRTILGHFGPVGSVAFSPDGKMLASGGWDNTVKLWDASTGEPLHTLVGHSKYVVSVAFSPDSKIVASGSGDSTVKLWDAATGQEVQTLRGHSRAISGVFYRPDGKYLASASFDKTVKLWDMATNMEAHTLRGHTTVVFGGAFSSDSKRLASVGSDGTAKVWDATTGRQVLTLRANFAINTSVAFNRDGTRLVVGGWDKTVRIWDLASGQEAITLRGHTDMVTSVAFSPDGQQIASANLDGTVKVWDADPVALRSDQESYTFRGHTGAVYRVAFQPDGKHLATASYDETVAIWDLDSRQKVRVLHGHAAPVYSLAFTGDGRQLASGDLGGTIKVWDSDTGKELHGFTDSYGILALSTDGKRLASGFEGGIAHIWDIATGKEELSFQAHAAPIFWMTFSPDGQQLATSGWDNTTKVWDATTGRAIHELRGHSHIVHIAVFSGDGKRLATGSWDQTAKIWDAATGKEVLTLRGHTDRVLSVAFSPDGKRLATASLDNTVKIWNAITGDEIRTLRGHAGYVLDVAFSPDGKWLASASGYRGNGEVKIWDATQWDEKQNP